MFARVLPDLGEAAVDRPYTYYIPPHLQGAVLVGGRVSVPLGRRVVSGYVLAVEDESEVDAGVMKPVAGVKSARGAFTTEQAALAEWLAETYLCPISEALRPCLVEPGKVGAVRGWEVTEQQGVTVLLADPVHTTVLQYLRAHPGSSSLQVKGRFGDAGISALDGLRRDGFIRPTGSEKGRTREINAIIPLQSSTELLTVADALPKRVEKQAFLLRWAARHLPGELPITVPEAARQAEVGDGVVRACIAKGWLGLEQVSLRRNPWDGVQGRKAIPPTLTEVQQQAVTAITRAADTRSAQSFLLYGVTGSGKTEVFLHAIQQVLAQGRQAIVLVPEISLTAQAMALYHGRFPDQVAVLHSHLSAGERFDEWGRIARGEAQVILGARSAIFAPCPELGLIIIDEEHESSYKQETAPRYHAKGVALQRGRLSGAPVVLASATPGLDSMREAELGIHTLLRLPERIEARPMPPVKLIDLRQQKKIERILSTPLREAISARLAVGQQTILFLNRRGYSYSLLCAKCGHFEVCPYCAVPLTYHKHAVTLRCHHCDFQKRVPAKCATPECPGELIAFKGVGTERLEEEVRTLWPEARLGRLDRDTTMRKGSHRAILDAFGNEETDILIGTQMVAKGFDFPKVTLVGVIAADTSLAVPDFRAPERTFQLLTQVAGRAGRGIWEGEVLVQSWQPDHYAVQAAAQHDYETFYRQEIRERESLNWPPVTSLINVLVNGEDESQVKATAADLTRRAREAGAARLRLPEMTATAVPNLFEIFDIHPEPAEEFVAEPADLQPHLSTTLLGVIVSDAVPCPLPRLRGRYRYHIELRGPNPATLRPIARAMQAVVPPKGIHVVVDVDPLSMA